MADVFSLPSTLDVSRLLVLHSVLSTITATSTRSPGYNLPIALFGLYAVEKNQIEGLRQFGALHGLSFVLDVLWLISGSRETGGFVTFLLLVNMFAKPVTLLAVSSNLKQQGLPTIGSVGIGGPLGGRQSTTVWSAEETPAYHSSSAYRADGEEDEDDLQQPAGRESSQSKSAEGGYHTIA